MARSYQNSKYTTGARMMGYNGQTEYITDTSSLNGSSTNAPSTTTTSSPTSGIGEEYNGGVAGDTLYLSDYILIKSIYGTAAAKCPKCTGNNYYWIASHRYYYGTTNFEFDGRSITSSGDIYNRYIRYYNSSGWADSNYSFSVRPILLLKSGLTIKSGTGAKNDSYILN